MSNAIVNLPMIKSGYVRSDYPTTVFPTSPGAEYQVKEGGVLSETWRLYFGFQAMSSSLGYKRLYDVRLKVQGKGSYCYFSPNRSDFNAANLTYENAPREAESYVWWRANFQYNSYCDGWAEYNYGTFSSRKSKLVKCAVLYGMQTDAPSNNPWIKTILAGGGTPYLEVTYDNSVEVKSEIKVTSAPTSGYVNPRNASAFKWWFDRDASESYYCINSFSQASAALKWRVSGASSWNTIAASGSTMSITVPANTFPTDSTIEWYLTGTDAAGTTSETPHYTFSTAAGTANAKAISPVSSVEDGSQPITLRWELSSTDGQAPAYIDLWWKLPETSSQNWTTILNHVSARTSHTLAAGYFPAGECQWMVRGYNVDNVAGPWSYINGVVGNYPSFVCVAAPDAPTGLQATQVPRTTISWQSEGQEAYEIEIDGTVVQKAFDPSASSWQVEEPLEDGTHTIRVRVQGVYGLWSAWSSVTAIIANNPPTTAVLAGEFDADAELLLEVGSAPAQMIIHWYRDGKRIAHTIGTQTFTDRMVLGDHVYYAEIWYDTGNYVRSNSVTGSMHSRCTRIASIEYESRWIELQLNESGENEQLFNWSRDSSARQVRGAKYPVLELSEFENLAGSYSCAFRDEKEARAMESLKGKVVIVKSHGDRVLIGALTSLTVSVKNLYITCSFTIRQIEWEDFVRYGQNG